MDILDVMGVSKLSAKVFFKKVNYSFKVTVAIVEKLTVMPAIIYWVSWHKRKGNDFMLKSIWTY